MAPIIFCLSNLRMWYWVGCGTSSGAEVEEDKGSLAKNSWQPSSNKMSAHLLYVQIFAGAHIATGVLSMVLQIAVSVDAADGSHEIVAAGVWSGFSAVATGIAALSCVSRFKRLAIFLKCTGLSCPSSRPVYCARVIRNRRENKNNEHVERAADCFARDSKPMATRNRLKRGIRLVLTDHVCRMPCFSQPLRRTSLWNVLLFLCGVSIVCGAAQIAVSGTAVRAKKNNSSCPHWSRCKSSFT